MEEEIWDHAIIAGAVETTKKSAEGGGIFLIAVFDLVKAVLFLVAVAGIFHLVDRHTHVE